MNRMELSEEERTELLEHRDALLDIRAMLAQDNGPRFFKYLFKHLEVGQLPPLGMEGNLLSDKLGSLRAGRAIFEIVSEADAETAARLLAEIEKEKYAKMVTSSIV
jgi:hypothetical protein